MKIINSILLFCVFLISGLMTLKNFLKLGASMEPTPAIEKYKKKLIFKMFLGNFVKDITFLFFVLITFNWGFLVKVLIGSVFLIIDIIAFLVLFLPTVFFP